MKEYDSYITCPQCSYPVPIVSPDALLHDECPLCGTDLTEKFQKEEQKLGDVRLLAFLKKFFDPPHLITRRELADFLAVSSTTIGEIRRSGELEAYDVSPSSSNSNELLRFTPHQVLEFLKSHYIHAPQDK